MAEKGFGVKEIQFVGSTPKIDSLNNINVNAVNVAISTNVSIGGTLTVTGNVSVGGTLTYEDVTNIDSVGLITARNGLNVTAGVSTFADEIHGNNQRLGSLSSSGRFNGLFLNDGNSYYGNSKLFVSSSTGFGLEAYGDMDSYLKANSGGGTSGNCYMRTGSSSGGYVFVNGDNGVEIHHAGTSNKKFETTSSGATVTGTLTATTFSGSGASLTNLPVADSDIQVAYTVTANGTSAYRFAGNGVVSTADNPDLYLIRGQKYRFINNSGGSHPFQIREASGGTAYSTGVTNNGASSGNIDFAPTYDSPAQLVYQCTSHGGMVGNIYLRDAAGNNTNVGVTTMSGNLTINSSASAKAIILPDNKRIYFGDGEDFWIGSNGTNGEVSGSLFYYNHQNYYDNVRLRIGNGQDLELFHNGTDSYIDNNTGNLYLDSASNIIFETGSSTERVRIDSSGYVSVGRAASALAYGSTNTMLEVKASDASNSIFETATFRGGADHNGAGARVRIVQGTHRGLVLEGGRTSNAAFGAIKITDQNGGLTSSVHIDSSGTWFWGKTSQSSGTAGVELYKDGPNFMTRNGTTVLGLNCQNGTNGDIMRFYFQDVHKGSLNFSSGTFSATTASDYRLKENDTPITDGIARVKKLKPIRFNFKENPSETLDGFFAHELQEVVPDCVTGEKDGEISERGEGYQCISKEGLVPLLTASIKDLIAKVETLEAEVAALKAK